MATLHFVNREEAFSTCKSCLCPGDTIVLAEDAVVLASCQSSINALTVGEVFALKPDLQARAINTPISVTAISYEQLVEQILRFEKTITW